MRILHVIQHLEIGGAERVVLALVNGARAAGHDVAVAAAPGRLAAELTVPRFDLPYLRRRVHRLPLVARAVARAMREWSPDLVHCQNAGVALATGVARAWRQKPTCLVTIQGEPDGDYQRTARLLRWLAMPVVACGPAVEHALAAEGVSAHTIPNGVGAAPPLAIRDELEQISSALRGRRIVVAVGRLVVQKNFDMIIRAMARLPEAALLIVGDGPLRDELERHASAAGVSDRVVFSGARTDARALMGAADAIAIASRWEGLSLVLLEALASGRPVVVARAPWLGDLVTDDQHALVVQDSADDLAQTIQRVLEDSHLAARLGAAGRARALEYSEDRTVAQYLAFYDRLMSPVTPT